MLIPPVPALAALPALGAAALCWLMPEPLAGDAARAARAARALVCTHGTCPLSRACLSCRV